MTTISGAHEEASLDGTGISHIPLVGRPEYAGLVPGMDTGDDASVMIRDGALSIVTDDLDLALAWRNAWQSACSALIEHRERGGIPHPDASSPLTPCERNERYVHMTESDHWNFVVHVKNTFPAIFDDASAYVAEVRTKDEAAS